MSNTPSETDNRAMAAQAIRGMKTARKFQVQSRRERRRVLIVCLAMLAAISLGLSLAMTTKLSTLLLSSVSEREIGASSAEARRGTIVLESAGKRCRQMTFDNDTGRTVEIFRSCKKDAVFDSQSPPQGTVRRLDAISKSLSKDR